MQATIALQTVRPFARLATSTAKATLREVGRLSGTCLNCRSSEHCVPKGCESEETRLLESIASRRIRLHKGEILFHAGEIFTSLYVVRSGSFKTVMPAEDGHDQVAGYHMAADVLGTDGFGGERHDCEAIALEEAEVCVLPFSRCEELAQRSVRFQRHLYRLMSQEITRERRITMILGTMRAEQRLATFLLDLSHRYQERGYSSVEFVLRMTREEIGSYLGLKLETVSRLFSRFHEAGLIQVHGRVVMLLDRIALKQL